MYATLLLISAASSSHLETTVGLQAAGLAEYSLSQEVQDSREMRQERTIAQQQSTIATHERLVQQLIVHNRTLQEQVRGLNETPITKEAAIERFLDERSPPLNVVCLSPPASASADYAMQPYVRTAGVRTLSMSTAVQEQTDYSSVTVEKAYGLASSASVTVQGEGVEAHMTYSFTIDAVTCDDIQKIVTDEYNKMDKEVQEQVDEKWLKGKAGLSGIFKILPFSVGASGGITQKNNNSKTTFTVTNKQNNLLRRIHDTTTQKLTVSGTLKAVGKSMRPFQAHAFVRVMHISYDDNKTLTVVDSPACPDASKAGDKNGQTRMIDTADDDDTQMNVTTAF